MSTAAAHGAPFPIKPSNFMTPASMMRLIKSGPEIAGPPEAPVLCIHLLQHALQVRHVIVPEPPNGRPRQVAAILDGVAHALDAQPTKYTFTSWYLQHGTPQPFNPILRCSLSCYPNAQSRCAPAVLMGTLQRRHHHSACQATLLGKQSVETGGAARAPHLITDDEVLCVCKGGQHAGDGSQII